VASDDAEIEAEMARVKLAIEEVVIHFITEALANLREETPVDTGHARANWVPSSGSPFDGMDGQRIPSRKVGDEVVKGSTTAGAAQAAGVQAIVSYKLEDGDAYVVNNVPYITGPGSLNDGHSTQAPQLFIEYAVHRAAMTVSQAHGLTLGAVYEGSG
jgi:hypothetical protein